MASEEQIRANRMNALKSTGPRTREGKAIASRNSLKHGLRARAVVIPGERQAAFESFRMSILDALEPEGAIEQILTERVVASAWRLRRSLRIESEMVRYHLELEQNLRSFYPAAYEAKPAPNAGQLVWRKFEWMGSYENFRRYEAHLEQGLYQALRELRRLQLARKKTCGPSPTDTKAGRGRTAA